MVAANATALIPYTTSRPANRRTEVLLRSDETPPLTEKDIRIHAWLNERLAVLHRERHSLRAKIRRFLFDRPIW
jgi:hypothetical protein